MPSIGIYNVFTIVDPMQVAQMQLEEITRNGVPGLAFNQIGVRGQEFSVRVISLLTSTSGVGQQLVNYASLVGGNPVQVVDDYGDTWNLMLVKGVVETRRRRVLASQPTGKQVILETEWRLQPLAVTY